jgi:hypothetical protein
LLLAQDAHFRAGSAETAIECQEILDDRRRDSVTGGVVNSASLAVNSQSSTA